MENSYLNLLKDTENIDFENLRVLMNKYPWFSALRIVWLLKHKKEKPELFPYELKKHIVYLRDRKHLFNILNTDVWQQIILENYDDPVEETSEPLIEDAEEYRKELLEFSYDPGIEDSADIGQEENSEASGITEEQGENEDQRSKDEFSEWIDEVDGDDKSGTSLIDRFLEIDPGPIRPVKETRLKGDISTPSVEESESFITDTLARIYIKQGLYSKAIFAYEKLSLKYPEKSVYFATQIEEIKKLINNN